jgi:hypothetical protein
MALPIVMDTASRIAPGTPSGKGVASTATQQSEQGNPANPDFLALLLAGLGLEPDTQAMADAAPSGTTHTGSQPPAKNTGGIPAKEKSKVPPNEVAFAVPVAVAVLPASLPEFTSHTTLDSKTGGRSDSRMSGDSGAPFLAGAYALSPQMESVAAASAPIPAPAASGNEADGPAARSNPFLESAPGPPTQGETAFEVRIQLPASDISDQPAPPTTGKWTDGSVAAGTVAAGTVAGTSNPASGPPITTAPSPPSPALSRQSAVPAGDHKDTGNTEPSKPLADRGVEPAQGKVPATDGTNRDFGGQERQDSASPKKDSAETARQPLDNSLRAAEPQTSGATVSGATPTGPGSATSPKAETSGAPVAHDAGTDVVSAARTGAPTRDIAIQLQDPGGPRVDVQLMDRAGTLHVVVRTQDDSLAKDLLPDLAQKLNQQGLEADAWSPVEMHNTSGGHENSGQAHEQTAEDAHSPAGGQDSGGNRDGDQPQRQRPDPEDEGKRSFSGLLTGDTAWQPTR